MTTLTAPVVAQVHPGPADALAGLSTSGSVAHAINVTATVAETDALTLLLDPGTSATVMDVLRRAATDADTAVRKAQRDGTREEYVVYLAARAHRIRTVVDAYEAEQVALHGPFSTYDLD